MHNDHVPNLYRPTKNIGPAHSLFLVAKLLHKLNVIDWRDLGWSVLKLNQYMERHDANRRTI